MEWCRRRDDYSTHTASNRNQTFMYEYLKIKQQATHELQHSAPGHALDLTQSEVRKMKNGGYCGWLNIQYCWRVSGTEIELFQEWNWLLSVSLVMVMNNGNSLDVAESARKQILITLRDFLRSYVEIFQQCCFVRWLHPFHQSVFWLKHWSHWESMAKLFPNVLLTRKLLKSEKGSRSSCSASTSKNNKFQLLTHKHTCHGYEIGPKKSLQTDN